VPPYGADTEALGGKRQRIAAGAIVSASIVILYLPPSVHQGLAWALRESALRPFIATQRRLADTRLRAERVDVLQQQLDSLVGALATQAAVEEENRTLRWLLDLSARAGPGFRATSVIRPGTPGSESLFFVDLGTRDGVRAGAPVIDPRGLVGVIREARADAAVGMDWTHPDFRASAMLADGSGFGMVEARRGAFREDDRLVLNGAAYYEEVPSGALVLTSGLSGVLPRGIPIGTIDGVADEEGRWRRSYWLRPRVQPAGVTHALVAVSGTGVDLSTLWPEEGAPGASRARGAEGRRVGGADSADSRGDSVSREEPPGLRDSR